MNPIPQLFRRPGALAALTTAVNLVAHPALAYASDDEPYGPDPYAESESFESDSLESGSFDCVIMPHAVVQVSSAVEGRIEVIHVERGDSVRRGQLLAELESSVEEANEALARYRASLDTEIRLRDVGLKYDNISQGRADELHEQKVLSNAALDEADREAELSVWRVRDAREKKRVAELEHTRALNLLGLKSVYSPIEGVVVDRFKWAGEYVEEDAIVAVAQFHPLRVEVVVPMELYRSIPKGSTVAVYPEVGAHNVHDAVVTLVDPMGDPASGTFRVELELPNPDNEVVSGINCKARFSALVADAPTKEVTPRLQSDREGGLTIFDNTPFDAAWSNGQTVTETLAPVALAEPADARVSVSEAPPCRSLGPVASEVDAKQLAARLRPRPGSVLRLRPERATVPNGFIVLATPADGDVAGLERRLRAAGVSDLQRLRHGEFGGRVALGIYNGLQTAERRSESLSNLGFDVVVAERTRSEEVWWVDTTAGPVAELERPVAVCPGDDEGHLAATGR